MAVHKYTRVLDSLQDDYAIDQYWSYYLRFSLYKSTLYYCVYCTYIHTYRVIYVQGYIRTGLYTYRVIYVQGYICTGLYMYRVIFVQGYIICEEQLPCKCPSICTICSTRVIHRNCKICTWYVHYVYLHSL